MPCLRKTSDKPAVISFHEGLKESTSFKQSGVGWCRVDGRIKGSVGLQC